jgi:hypothetical protein
MCYTFDTFVSITKLTYYVSFASAFTALSRGMYDTLQFRVFAPLAGVLLHNEPMEFHSQFTL